MASSTSPAPTTAPLANRSISSPTVETPVFPPPATNPAISLLSVLGACPSTGTFAGVIPYINLTEATTVAAAYALSGYMTDATHVSSSASALAQQGIANAFLTVNNLVSITSGQTVPFSVVGNGVPPQATINTLADVLAACVNTDGATSPSSAPCGTLFANAKDLGGNIPSDTATAALNIAHNPGANVLTLYNLAVPQPPFQPSLTAAPNDWTIAITFYTDTMAGPYYPAFDAAGDLWVPRLRQQHPHRVRSPRHPALRLQRLLRKQPQPALLRRHRLQPERLGLQLLLHRLRRRLPLLPQRLRQRKLPLRQTLHRRRHRLHPEHLDRRQLRRHDHAQLWTPHLPVQHHCHLPQPGHRLQRPRLVSRQLTQSLSAHPSDTVAQYPEAVTSTLTNDLVQFAIDSSDNVWFSSGKNNALGRVDSSGNLVSPPAGYTGGGLTYPAQLAIDGSNRVWVANRDGNSVSAFTNAGTPISPSNGYQPSGQVPPDPTVDSNVVGVRAPHGLAIDGSGNVWVTNFIANSVTEFIGLATPRRHPHLPHQPRPASLAFTFRDPDTPQHWSIHHRITSTLIDTCPPVDNSTSNCLGCLSLRLSTHFQMRNE